MAIPSLQSVIDIKRYDKVETALDDRAAQLGRSLYTKLPDWDLVARMQKVEGGVDPAKILEGSTRLTEAVISTPLVVDSLSPTAELPRVLLGGLSSGATIEVDCAIAPKVPHASPAHIVLEVLVGGTLAFSAAALQFQQAAHAMRVKGVLTINAVTPPTFSVNAMYTLVGVIDGTGTSESALPTFNQLAVPLDEGKALITTRVGWVSGHAPFSIRVLNWHVVGKAMSA